MSPRFENASQGASPWALDSNTTREVLRELDGKPEAASDLIRVFLAANPEVRAQCAAFATDKPMMDHHSVLLGLMMATEIIRRQAEQT